MRWQGVACIGIIDYNFHPFKIVTSLEDNRKCVLVTTRILEVENIFLRMVS